MLTILKKAVIELKCRTGWGSGHRSRRKSIDTDVGFVGSQKK